MVVDKKKNTQVLVTFPKKLLKEVEEYLIKEKLMNRNEAIRQLIRLGLKRGL